MDGWMDGSFSTIDRIAAIRHLVSLLDPRSHYFIKYESSRMEDMPRNSNYSLYSLIDRLTTNSHRGENEE